MGNCDSCLGGRERSKTSVDEPVQHTPSSKPRVERNEIQFASGSGARSPGFGVNYRIVPFDDRRPSIQLPTPMPEKPRKPYGI